MRIELGAFRNDSVYLNDVYAGHVRYCDVRCYAAYDANGNSLGTFSTDSEAIAAITNR